MKKKHILLRILPWFCLLLVVGGIGYVGYLLWGRPEAEPLYTAEVVRFEEEDAKTLVMDNGSLHFELDPLTTQFTLTDAYGHTWNSNPFSDPAKSGENVASGDNKNALASTLNVYYRLPKKAVDNMYDSYSYSVSRSAYQVRQREDGAVEVTYSIGDIAREYVIPGALSKARYDEVLQAVQDSGTSKKKVTGKFSQQKSADTLSKLTGTDQAAKEAAQAALSTYPALMTQDVYVTTATDNNNMASLEKILSGAGYGEEEQTLDIILTRSTFNYTYEKVSPEQIAQLREGSEEEKTQADIMLAALPELEQTPGYLLRRLSQNYTPSMVETMLEGSDEQASRARELMEAYPAIQTDAVTIVALPEEETNRYYTIAELLDESSYTEIERIQESSLFEAANEYVPVLFDVTVVYRLDGEDFVAEVPFDSLRFNSANASLSAITLLPMFGAVGAQPDGSYEDGYLLVPEGGGALIHFNNQKLKQSSYFADMYGYDYGIKRSEFISESKALFPVFGVLRDEQSFLCVVEGGASQISIQADINGVETGSNRSSYNYVNARMKVLHVDQYNVSAKTAELQLMYEKKLPQTTLVQRYRFTNNGEYAALAASYGDYLRETFPELQSKLSSEHTPFSVELVGAIDKRVVVAGLPVKKMFAMTTFEQAEEIIDFLSGGGIQNLNVRYSGWLKGGVKQKALTSVRVLSELGGISKAKSLIQKAREANVPLYFDGITAFVYNSNLLDGFLTTRDTARHITREVALLSPFSPVYYHADDEQDSYYLAYPLWAKENASHLIAWAKDNDAYGVSFRDIGTMLSADYNPDHVISREQVKELNIATLAEAKEAGRQVMVREGFDFTLPYVNLITDMDLSGMRYLLIDQYIPFYQMAIHGMVDYTGQALNLDGDYQTELLRSVEYGAGLNYTFFAESGKMVQETNYTGLYGAAFASWNEEACATMLRYQQETEGLNQQRITGHEEPNAYLRVTTYEDGTKVYVNYSTEDYQGEVTVPARDYLVVRGRNE